MMFENKMTGNFSETKKHMNPQNGKLHLTE